jgi:hypothetical protein
MMDKKSTDSQLQTPYDVKKVKVLYLAPPGPKDCQTLHFPDIETLIPDAYILSLPSNSTDRPKHLSYLLLSCPVFPAALSSPFSSLLM